MATDSFRALVIDFEKASLASLYFPPFFRIDTFSDEALKSNIKML